MLNLSVSIAWWWLPVGLVVAGAGVASWRCYVHRASYLADVVFLFWFLIFCAAAVGVSGAKVLLS